MSTLFEDCLGGWWRDPRTKSKFWSWIKTNSRIF